MKPDSESISKKQQKRKNKSSKNSITSTKETVDQAQKESSKTNNDHDEMDISEHDSTSTEKSETIPKRQSANEDKDVKRKDIEDAHAHTESSETTSKKRSTKNDKSAKNKDITDRHAHTESSETTSKKRSKKKDKSAKKRDIADGHSNKKKSKTTSKTQSTNKDKVTTKKKEVTDKSKVNDPRNVSKENTTTTLETQLEKGTNSNNEIGRLTVYYGSDGRKEFRNLALDRELSRQSVKYTTNLNNFYSWWREKIEQLNKRCKQESRNQISNADIAQSTLQTRSIETTDYCPIPNELCYFANISYGNIDEIAQAYMDTQNANVYIIPLQVLTNTKDFYPILHHSRMTLELDQQVEGIRKFVYECHFINNLHQSSNHIVRQVLEEFFVSIFVKETEHIKRLLHYKETMVLLIVNRDIEPREGNLEIQHIIAAVMFCTNKYDGILIDFLCAGSGYHGYGYGTLLLHFAQVFGREQITKESNKKKFAKEVITCLACRMSLIPYYKNLGFDYHPYEDFLPKHRFSFFGKRIEIQEWLENEDKRLRCMSIDRFVPRYLNVISPDKLGVEKSLYDTNLMSSFKKLQVPQKYLKNIGIVIEKQIEIIKTKLVTREDMNSYRNSRDVQHYSQVQFLETFYLPLGKWFQSVFKDYIEKCDLNFYKHSKTMCLAMEHFQVQFIPNKSESRELDKCPMWICMRCGLCKKKAYVFKQPTESFTSFMLKVVYSLWFSHVFSYEIFEIDKWHELNKDWTICARRYGEYLYNLKISSTFDKETLLQSEAHHKKIYIWKIYLQKFFEALGSKYYIDLVEELIAFTTFLQSEVERENSITVRKRKACKTYIQMSYSDTNNNERFNNSNKKMKSKNDRLLKKKRHDAEQKWNEIFYNDIDSQLLFKKIEFVNAEKPPEELHEASKKYYKYRNKLKKRNFIDHFGELQKVEHYLAYYEDGSADILDEDWFFVEAEDENETTQKEYRIMPSKWKQINKNPNKAHNLSSKDKSRIRKHCHRLLGLCDIKSIKRIENNEIEDPDQRVETVHFFEKKEKDNKSEYVTHVSCSKYEFEGIDRHNRVHKISKDWVELNFKVKDPTTYKQICELEVGNTLKFSPGSSNISSGTVRINKEDQGCQTRFIQGKEPSCLFISLANALHLLEEDQLALKLVKVYNEFFHSSKQSNKPSMKDILMITKSNQYHKEGERRFKFLIQKTKHPINALDILESDKSNPDIIYHCVLTNLHSICLVGTMIIDPVFAFTLPRNEQYLRFCAELNDESFDQTKDLIYQCYKYTKPQSKRLQK